MSDDEWIECDGAATADSMPAAVVGGLWKCRKCGAQAIFSGRFDPTVKHYRRAGDVKRETLRRLGAVLR